MNALYLHAATIAAGTMCFLGITSTTVAQSTLEQRIPREQKFIDTCQRLSGNTDPNNSSTWTMVYLLQSDTVRSKQAVASEIARKKASGQWSETQAHDVAQGILKMTAQMMRNCAANAGPVYTQLQKDLTAKSAMSSSPSSGSLSSEWKCDDGGSYSIKQSGDNISWYAKSSDDGRTWQHEFTGYIAGDQISGNFEDQAPGANRNKGTATFKIVNNRHLQRTGSTGEFACSNITR